jgi:hypothetical protein
LLADKGGDELIVRGTVTPVSMRTRYHPFRIIFTRERLSRRSSTSRKSSRARATSTSRRSTRAAKGNSRKRK